MNMQLSPGGERRAQVRPWGPPGQVLTPEDLSAFFSDLEKKGREAGTLEIYRHNVHALYDGLPEDKTVRTGTLDQWREKLLEEGYSPRTVNVRISVANSLMAFLGRRDLQSVGALETPGARPELTRAEYLRLLTTARALDKERLYLLVKLFGSTELSVSGLSRLTVEVLQGRTPGPVRLPEFLRRELLDYARRESIASGPVFCTRQGKPLGRTAVTDSLKQLCRDARVEEEKVNPRCLRQLWQATQEEVRAQLDVLVEQTCDRLLETEQLSIGWDSNRGVRGP